MSRHAPLQTIADVLSSNMNLAPFLPFRYRFQTPFLVPPVFSSVSTSSPSPLAGASPAPTFPPLTGSPFLSVGFFPPFVSSSSSYRPPPEKSLRVFPFLTKHASKKGPTLVLLAPIFTGRFKRHTLNKKKQQKPTEPKPKKHPPNQKIP